MKVLMLTTSFPLFKGAISGIFIRHLIEHLPKNVDVTVLTPDYHCPLPTHQSPRYELKCFRYAPRVWQILIHQPGGMPAALRSKRYALLLLPVLFMSMGVVCLRLARHVDVIHANWSVNGVIAGLAGRLTKTPVVTTLRGSDIARVQHSFIDRIMLQACLALNTKVVGVSHSICNFVKKNFPKWSHKVKAVPNGVGTIFLNAKPQTHSGINLVCIGNLIPQKGVDTIIKALKKINNPDVQLHIVGDGAERSNLELLTQKLGLARQVHFTGQIPHDQVPEYLSYMDALILGSFSEGRPNVVLEAMAAGVPVIATSIDGVQELIFHEQNGLIFTPGDACQLARHIERLIQDVDLQKKFSRAGKKFIMENGLTWKKVSGRYAALYEDAIKCAG